MTQENKDMDKEKKIRKILFDNIWILMEWFMIGFFYVIVPLMMLALAVQFLDLFIN